MTMTMMTMTIVVSIPENSCILRSAVSLLADSQCHNTPQPAHFLFHTTCCTFAPHHKMHCQ